MAETKKSKKSGFSAEERAAMRAAAAERKASQKQQNLDKALAEAIAKLQATSGRWRRRSTRSCASTRRCSPRRRTYCTIGFDAISNLDDGDMWPTSFAILKIGP